jgi:hypothetical protein
LYLTHNQLDIPRTMLSLSLLFFARCFKGVYHSIYDSFDWIDNWGGVDGETGSAFQYMSAASKVWGVLAMRLASDQFVPFDHFVTSKALFSYLAQVGGDCN